MQDVLSLPTAPGMLQSGRGKTCLKKKAQIKSSLVGVRSSSGGLVGRLAASHGATAPAASPGLTVSRAAGTNEYVSPPRKKRSHVDDENSRCNEPLDVNALFDEAFEFNALRQNCLHALTAAWKTRGVKQQAQERNKTSGARDVPHKNAHSITAGDARHSRSWRSHKRAL